MLKRFAAISFFAISLVLNPTAKASEQSIQIAPEAFTVAPVFLGAGVRIALYDHYELGLSYGFTPKAYSSLIGQVASDSAGNSSYRDVIEAAFQNNSILRAAAQYNFTSATSGWRAGLAVSSLTSSGRAGIDTVLRASTGNDYTLLKNLLVAAGRRPDVDLNGTLLIGELQSGYAWELTHGVCLAASVGVAKVLEADIRLKTGLPNFEATAFGNNLLRQSESDLEAIVNQYGLSPTLGASVSYVF